MAKNKKVTPDELNQIRAMTMAGDTQQMIAEKLGLTKVTVYRHQKAMGLKASNRWRFGESPFLHPEVAFESKVEEPKVEVKTETQTVEKKHEPKFVTVADRSIKLKGAKSGFTYEYRSLESKSIIIEMGYSEPIEIDINDLATFGNELLDVAEMIDQMRKAQ